MASLRYLWRNRIKYRPFSKAFFISWAKRLLTFPELVKNNRRRKKLINNGANIAETAEIGIVNINGRKENLSIDDFSTLGKVEIALHDKVSIGKYVCINDGVIILSASHDVSDPLWRHKKAPISIGDYAWIATNAIILPGVNIGKGAVVGAGAVVSKDVKDYTIVIGNPAKEIEKKRTEVLKYNPCEFLATNNAWLK
ncbi:acyltransferase [Flavobacterium quisquiliarum]|uniref:Acyltransferase n=1 Tax=Flavobacterium quisquiliarum TaxID=1834436 RepID=A0ABV8W3A4_9FLAO|nr:acyltransferase [Flavobacterium quisquiliarum]MBW1655019.1 acyltransferase [Flavobacterium quisquiliarum]NWL02610.1 acetyltransferase [Flavobacterium collinsii]